MLYTWLKAVCDSRSHQTRQHKTSGRNYEKMVARHTQSAGGLFVTSLKYWTWRWARCSSVSRCLVCFWSQRFLWWRCRRQTAPELTESSGTARDTKLSVFQIILFTFWVNRGSWPLTCSKQYPWSLQSLPSDRTAGVSSSSCTVTNWFKSWTKTCASSVVCTSPFAVNTTVGFQELFTVYTSSELNFFFAHHVHLCSWKDSELSLLWSRWSRCRIPFAKEYKT